MTDSDPLRRYVEAGMALTQLTRARAEAMVKDLVRAGEVQREQAQDRVEELLDRSRRSTEGLIGLVRKEVAQQLSSMGFATREDLEKLEARLEGRLAAMATKSATKRAGKAPPRTAAKAAGHTARKGPVGRAAEKTAAPPPGTAARTAAASKLSPRRSGPGPGAADQG